jgi:hypothetical protein
VLSVDNLAVRELQIDKLVTGSSASDPGAAQARARSADPRRAAATAICWRFAV